MTESKRKPSEFTGLTSFHGWRAWYEYNGKLFCVALGMTTEELPDAKAVRNYTEGGAFIAEIAPDRPEDGVTVTNRLDWDDGMHFTFNREDLEVLVSIMDKVEKEKQG